HNLKVTGSNPVPATTSIIIHSSSTADADVAASYQSLTHVPTLERGSGDSARPRHAVAYRATCLPLLFYTPTNNKGQSL
ncbi:hypothetical protein, partial [Acetobacter sp.]|uniref:hypothetical protein n=1 Tax=Acetobacter sp. TaxID=440 RepID=UPI0039E7F455